MMHRKFFWANGFIWIGAALIGASLGQTGCAPARPAALPAPPPAPMAPAEAPKPTGEPLPGLIVSEIEGKREPERLYSLSLRGAEVREVLMALAKQTDFNIVVDPKVKGNITVDLKNVTLTELLDTLTELADAAYSIKQNIIRVFEPVPETRIFALQYVNLKRAGATATSAQIGASSAGVAAVAGGASVGASGQTTLSTTTETDLWKEIEAGVVKMLSPKGKTVVDRQSGNILVTDLPKHLEQIAGFLEAIEGSVQRQVLIEARIVEVTLTGEYRFGLDWSAIAQAGALRGASTIAPRRIIGQRLAPSAGEFQVGVSSTDFSTLLTVLNKQGEINVLSGPKLATLNNQTALIRSATDEVFFERRVIETFVNGTPRVTTEVTPRTVTVGVVLAVTPQIGPDGNVVLHVRPTVTERTGVAEFREGQTVFTAPILDVREADLVVRAREGQIVVIGGLMQEKKTDDESKVPLLGDMPGLGRLFRSTNQERRKTELVVLLSPTVMVGKKIDEITFRELDRLNRTRGRSPW